MLEELDETSLVELCQIREALRANRFDDPESTIRASWWTVAPTSSRGGHE